MRVPRGPKYRTLVSQVRCEGDRNHHQASRQFQYPITPGVISLADCTTPVYPIDFVVAVCCSCLQNGRIKGDAKKALRGVIEQYGIPVTLSANQNILLRDLEPAWKEDIQARLEVSTQILSHYHMWGLA